MAVWNESAVELTPTGGRWVEYKLSDVLVDFKKNGTNDTNLSTSGSFSGDERILFYVVDKDNNTSTISNKDHITHIWMPSPGNHPDHSPQGGWMFVSNGTAPVQGGATENHFTITAHNFFLINQDGTTSKDSPTFNTKFGMDIKTVTPYGPGTSVPCFGPDVEVMVAYSVGNIVGYEWVKVKDLREGDMIQTVNENGKHGMSSVLWVGGQSAIRTKQNTPVVVNGEVFSPLHRILQNREGIQKWMQARFLVEEGKAEYLNTEDKTVMWYHILMKGHKTIVTRHNLVESLRVTAYSMSLMREEMKNGIMRAVAKYQVSPSELETLKYEDVKRKELKVRELA